MFDNIGGKIKVFSVIFFIVGIIGSIIGGIIMLVLSGVIGLLLLIGGPISILIITLFAFRFGHLVENSEIQKTNTLTIVKLLKALEAKLATEPQQQTAPTPVRPVHTAPAPVKPVQTAPAKQYDMTPDNTKEPTYLFALQMYQQRSYNIALNAFLKIRGYKDADKYIEELQR